MSGFRTFEAKHQRLALLQVLAEASGYSHNEDVLRTALRALGHSVSRDALRTQLSWLAEQGLVRTQETASLVVASLTDRGEDVSQGLAQIPGVARPRPGR